MSQTRRSLTHWRSWLLAGLTSLTFLDATHAQIITDGRVGPQVSLSGAEMTIGADLGDQRGSNLFHSFERFDIPAEQRATFTGPDNIQRVIGRVTGGYQSHIDGHLRSEVGQADVYLINPAGVVMGSEVQVEVPGALHVSAADELRFDDGAVYSASDPARSTLTMAAPESFGFLTPQQGAIQLKGTRLEVQPQQTATLTAKEISITGTAERPARIAAPGGTVRAEAVGGTSVEVPVAAPAPDHQHSGTLQLSHAQFDTSGDGGGTILVRAGDAILTHSTLATDNLTATEAMGGMDLSLSNDLHLRASRVQSNVFDAGGSGILRVEADTLTIEQAEATTLTGLLSEVEPGGSGAAGDITVAVGDALIMHGAVGIASATFGSGASGAVAVRAPQVSLDGAGVLVPYRNTVYIGGIASEVGPGARGSAGRVVVEVANALIMRNSGVISSSTQGTGSAGQVRVHAGTLDLDGPLVWIASSVYSGAGPQATGGHLSVEVDETLTLASGAAITSETESQGAAGTVRVEAGAVRLSDLFTRMSTNSYLEQDNAPGNGPAGDLQVEVRGELALLSGASISSSTFGRGAAGRVGIAAGALTIDGGSETESFTGIRSQNYVNLGGSHAGGPAGDLIIEVAGPLRMVNRALINSSTFNSAPAGTVYIQADDIDLHAGALIASETYNAGDGGTVTMRAGNLSMSGNSDWLAKISANAQQGASGAGGSIDIGITERLDLRSGATIESNTFGQGDAGTLTIEAGALDVLNGAYISSDTWAAGNAGKVRIYAGKVLVNRQGAADFTGIWSAAELGSTGHAGEVTLEIDHSLEILNGGWISSGTWGVGNAGGVTVQANGIIVDSAGHEGFTGIDSLAAGQSIGQVGYLNIHADYINLRNNGQVSIQADQSLLSPNIPEAQLSIHADRLDINGGFITTHSTGNVPAATIRIDGGVLILQDGQIITSAEGSAASGGDIHLSPKQLVLDGGFIQANAASVGASGGDIYIDSQALIARHDQVSIGGNERQVFILGSGVNVIQAAAPLGVQGDIALMTPDLDISAALAPVRTAFEDPDAILSNLCQITNLDKASTLIPLGTGGLPLQAQTPLTTPIDAGRLKRLLPAAD